MLIKNQRVHYFCFIVIENKMTRPGRENAPSHYSDIMSLPISVIETEIDRRGYTINQQTAQNCSECNFIFKKITKSIIFKERRL